MFNLCSEKTYDTSFFHGRVERVLIDDHNVPSLQQMLEFANKVPDDGIDNTIYQFWKVTRISMNQSPQPTQNFWVFSFYIADFWQTFWVIWENGSNWSNLRLKMKFFALGRLKNHNVPHLHSNSTMFMPLDRLFFFSIYIYDRKFHWNMCKYRADHICDIWMSLSSSCFFMVYQFVFFSLWFTQDYSAHIRLLIDQEYVL